MCTIQYCSDLQDVIVLNEQHNLFLKPIACLHISVQLPALKSAGKSISNWEIMDRIKSAAKPHEFIGMKVLKSTLQYVRIEAQLESRHEVSGVLKKLDRSFVKLNGHSDVMKMRAQEANIHYPSRHDWDMFFQESKNMNEMKPGERPDTVHVSMLPSHWFSNRNELKNQHSKPSETIIRTVFETFGPLRAVDIPVLDPYRSRMISKSSNTFVFGQDGLFEVYLQYKEYMGFVKCMTAFKGMKLLHKEPEKSCTALIQVDFDRTRHLSEGALLERRNMREKCIQDDIDHERAEKARREFEIMKQEEMRRLERMNEEEVLARMKEEQKMKEEQEIVAHEEKKLIMVQRKLESLRLLDALLERIKASVEAKEKQRKEMVPKVKESSKKKEKLKKAEKEERRQRKLEEKEKSLRTKLIQKYQEVEQQRLEEQREKLRQTVQSSALKLKSAVNIVYDQKTSGAATHFEERVITMQPLSQADGETDRMRADHINRRRYSSPARYNNRSNQPHPYFKSGRYESGPNNHADQHPFHQKRHSPESLQPRQHQVSRDSGWNNNRGRGDRNWNQKGSNRVAHMDELWEGPRTAHSNGIGHRPRGRNFRDDPAPRNYHQPYDKNYKKFANRFHEGSNGNHNEVAGEH